MLIRGELGWGEFCAFPEYDDREAAGWLATAVEQVTVGWPAPVRDRIPVNCTVPAVDAERAERIVRESGCATAKVKVADHPDSLAEDLARVAAVREAIGESGADVAVLKCTPLGGVRRALAVAVPGGLRLCFWSAGALERGPGGPRSSLPPGTPSSQE